MNLRSSVLRMITSVNGSWDVSASYLGMTSSALHNRAYHVRGQSLTVEQALALQGLSGTTYFAEAIAAESGGVFLKMPAAESTANESLGKKFHELYIELGTFSQNFIDATADDEIDAAERAKLEAIVRSMQRNLSELLALSFRVYCRDGIPGNSTKAAQ